jgi:hypothetical protein
MTHLTVDITATDVNVTYITKKVEGHGLSTPWATFFSSSSLLNNLTKKMTWDSQI